VHLPVTCDLGVRGGRARRAPAGGATARAAAPPGGLGRQDVRGHRLSPHGLQHGSRRAPSARTREGLAYLALEVFGYPGPGVAYHLGVRPSSVYRAARGRWEPLLTAEETGRHIRKQRRV
jgi:hypothetical protein